MEGPVSPSPTLLLRHLTYEARIVGTRSRGGWRSQAFEYALLRDWIDLPRTLPSAEEAVAALAPLYFEANGPATLANFAWWAGVTTAMARGIADRLKLETVSMEGLEEVHFATREVLDDLESLRSVPSTNLVPYWDAYIMAQNDRRRYLDPKWANRVVDRGGNATNVVLKDGRVAGVWDCVGDALLFAPFESLDIDAVRAGAEPLRGLLGFRAVRRAPMPGPLVDRGQNAFMSPLRRVAGS